MVIIKMVHTINQALKRLDDFKRQSSMTNITPTESQKRRASFAGDLALSIIFKENDGDYSSYPQIRYDNGIEHISALLGEDELTIYLPRKGRFGVSKHEVSNEQLNELIQELCYDLLDALYRIRETVSNINNDDNLLAVKLCLLLGADWHSMGKLNSRVLTDVLTGRERFIPDYEKNLFTQEERETYFPKGGAIDIADKDLLDFLLSSISFSINAIPVHAKSCYSKEEAYNSRWLLPSLHSHRRPPLSEATIFGSGRLVGVAEEEDKGMLLTLLANTVKRTQFLDLALGARNMNTIEVVDANLSIMTGDLKKSLLSLSSKALQKPNRSTRDGIIKTWALQEGALGQEEVF